MAPAREATMSEDARFDAMRALTQFLVADASLSDTLLRVAQITTDAMPAAEMAGISLLDDDGRPTTAVFTDEESPQVDAGQYDSGRGRALTPGASSRSCASMTWTEAQSTIRVRPVGSGPRPGQHYALPLVVGDEGIGALNLYARRDLDAGVQAKANEAHRTGHGAGDDGDDSFSNVPADRQAVEHAGASQGDPTGGRTLHVDRRHGRGSRWSEQVSTGSARPRSDRSAVASRRSESW